jgi:hypothetical protein
LCVGLYIFPTIVAGMRRQLIERSVGAQALEPWTR